MICPPLPENNSAVKVERVAGARPVNRRAETDQSPQDARFVLVFSTARPAGALRALAFA